MLRKQRTREHIIADLSVNHFERFVFRGGHTGDRTFFDYGYDLTVRTFNRGGEIEADLFYVQLKASDSLAYNRDGSFVSFAVNLRDAMLWLSERNPVILALYDANRDIAYWAHFQDTPLSSGGTIRVSTTSVVNDEGIEAMRQLKNRLLD